MPERSVSQALLEGKPGLTLPEAHDFEQKINARFQRESGAGGAVPMAGSRPGTIRIAARRLLRLACRTPTQAGRRIGPGVPWLAGIVCCAALAAPR